MTEPRIIFGNRVQSEVELGVRLFEFHYVAVTKIFCDFRRTRPEPFANRGANRGICRTRMRQGIPVVVDGKAYGETRHRC